MAAEITQVGATPDNNAEARREAVAAANPPAATSGTTSGGTPTVLTPTEDKGAAHPADWPQDWRERLASNDTKTLDRLKRFTAPADLFKSYRELETKLSAGEYRPVAPPKDATEEDVAAWRKSVGIPDKPEGYLEHLDKGLVIGDDDKKAITDFLADMHKANLPPAAVKASIDWYYKNLEGVQTEQLQRDTQARGTTEDELRGEWGNEYRRNINVISGYLDTWPEGTKDAILNARGPDGIPLFSNPNVVRAFLKAAISENPAATVAPGGIGGAGASIDARMAELEKMMGNHGSDYWRGPQSQKLQAEYRDLISARDSIKQRRTAA